MRLRACAMRRNTGLLQWLREGIHNVTGNAPRKSSWPESRYPAAAGALRHHRPAPIPSVATAVQRQTIDQWLGLQLMQTRRRRQHASTTGERAPPIFSRYPAGMASAYARRPAAAASIPPSQQQAPHPRPHALYHKRQIQYPFANWPAPCARTTSTSQSIQLHPSR